MTIFQKMLLVPVLALMLYSGFIIYSYFEHQQSSVRIESIRDHYVPLLEVVNANISLFEQLTDMFKDAVLAGESGWLKNTWKIKQEIEINLAKLGHHPEIVDLGELNKSREVFSRYYNHVELFANKMLNNEDALAQSGNLIQSVNHYHNATQEIFSNLKLSIKRRFSHNINHAIDSLNKMLFWSMVISFFSMSFLIVVMLKVSLSTRRSLHQVVVRMKDLALGKSDFSRRLIRDNKDELGQLIYWFNKLSDKMEQDYVNLETISITDKLTQLNNRTRTDAYFPMALQEAKDKHTVLAAVLLDIDHFKSVNDNYGHLTGDKILQSLAGILKQHAQQHDFVARWGGEEFIIVIKHCTAQQAQEKMNKLRVIIAQHKFPDVGQVTVSFGIALSRSSDTPEEIMERADKCLYKAKEQGRNCVVLVDT